MIWIPGIRLLKGLKGTPRVPNHQSTIGWHDGSSGGNIYQGNCLVECEVSIYISQDFSHAQSWVFSCAKKDRCLNFGCFFLKWNCWEGRYDSWCNVCVCVFVDMVVKQSETCFWCRFMSPCYPAVQKNLDKDHYFPRHTWYSRYWYFDHPFLFFIGHLFISTLRDVSPPKHVVDHLPSSFRLRRLRTSRKLTRKKKGASSKIKYH